MITTGLSILAYSLQRDKNPQSATICMSGKIHIQRISDHMSYSWKKSTKPTELIWVED